MAIAALAAIVAGAVGWTDPVGAGDLRPSPDAVEYALDAVALARFQVPAVRIGDATAPPRYPPGFPALAAPAFWLPSRARPVDLGRAVLATLAAGVATAAACAWMTHRLYGRAAAALATALIVLSPFFQRDARLVMAEVPSAMTFAALAAVMAGRSAPAGGGIAGKVTRRWVRAGVLAGLLCALSVTIRLANVQVVPAALLGLWVAEQRHRSRLLLTFGGALAAGLVPLLASQLLLYGSPLRTGYHVWTPEWAGGGRPVFSLAYAAGLPALPSRAVQPNVAHYVAAWVGAVARGDAGEPVPSPIHPALAALVGLAAVGGAGRGLSSRSTRACTLFVLSGVASALSLYAVYYYQDVRFIAPWVPLWLALAAGGVTWPAVAAPPRLRWPARIVAAVAGLALLAPLLPVIPTVPLWQRTVLRRATDVPPRLAQVRRLAAELPVDAWLVSALDGPYVDYYVLRGTARRFLPLARGLEFVDKPPLQSVATAEQAHGDLVARVDRGAVVALDRWSLEFAEGLPDFRREVDRAVDGFDFLPGGAQVPIDPSYYALAVHTADNHLAAWGLVNGTGIRGSGPDVFVMGDGRRRHVRSLAALARLGLRWQDVRRIPDRVLAAIPEGPPFQ